MRHLVMCILGAAISLPAWSQWTWNDPCACAFPVFQNQGFSEEIGKEFQRLPDRAKPEVREAVWNLSQETAGLALCFRTDARELKVRYQVKGGYAMPHMPSTGVSGVDLYQTDGQGRWTICFSNYSFGDTIAYSYQIKNETEGMVSYYLYLPLYNGVKWLQVGVPEGSRFEYVPASTEEPIVVYGTSIAQGACASRPGMAWTNIVQRTLQCPVVNLGFSGNGRLEEGVLDFIGEIPARLYVIDCMANLPDEPDEVIYERALAAVRQLRAKHDTPILLVEHAGYSQAESDTTQFHRYHHTNLALRRAYRTLKEEKVPNLFYLSHDELNYHPDSWVDYVHPSDWGMRQQAEAVISKARTILGPIKTK